jgi:5'-methylthioadenosine phosphorylase
MAAKAAIIGGTGIGTRLAKIPGRKLLCPTPYGPMRARIIEHKGVEVAIVERHSAGHKTPPHQVNYRAIADGLNRIGINTCLSSAAVGTLHRDWKVGEIAICSDMIDLTGRQLTLCDRDVQHAPMNDPFPARTCLLHTAAVQRIEVQTRAVYVATNGPRYESEAEIHMIDRIGGDLVGMTAATEAVVMREADIEYGCLAVVTNYAAGIAGSMPEHGEVSHVMNTRGELAVQLLLDAAIEGSPCKESTDES